MEGWFIGITFKKSELSQSGLLRCSDEELRTWIHCLDVYFCEHNVPKSKRLQVIHQNSDRAKPKSGSRDFGGYIPL